MLFFKFLLSFAAAAPAFRTLFKISSRTHSPSLISSLLLTKYKEIGSGTNLSKAQALALTETCSNNAVFRYVLESAQVAQTSVPASECRLNRDDYYQTVILPLSYFQASLYDDNEVDEELRQRLRSFLLEVLPGLTFSNFTDLNYELECHGDHYELTQVVLKQTVIKAALKLHVSVTPECSFSQFASHLENDYTTLVEIELPVNGSFVCTTGRTEHCSMKNAIATLLKLRSPPF